MTSFINFEKGRNLDNFERFLCVHMCYFGSLNCRLPRSKKQSINKCQIIALYDP